MVAAAGGRWAPGVSKFKASVNQTLSKTSLGNSVVSLYLDISLARLLLVLYYLSRLTCKPSRFWF